MINHNSSRGNSLYIVCPHTHMQQRKIKAQPHNQHGGAKDKNTHTHILYSPLCLNILTQQWKQGTGGFTVLILRSSICFWLPGTSADSAGGALYPQTLHPSLSPLLPPSIFQWRESKVYVWVREYYGESTDC